jgi:formylglycine-generating enzyme required for sulfatase activity
MAMGLAIALLSGSAAHAQDRDAPAGPPPPAYTDPTTGIELVHVRGGCFPMGDLYADSEDTAPYAAETPVHEVCVGDFYIGRYEVTRAQWRALMPSDPSVEPECGASCPVSNVTWAAIQEFIGKLNARAGGQKFRLPTEAEWEYAARSGGRTERYSGGNDVESVSKYDYACARPGGRCIQPVGSKLANGLGLYDMSGNVHEVTSDWLGVTYYSASPRDNPRGPESGKYHVERGGCGSGGPRNSRVSRRGPFADPSGGTGFRLLRVP